MGEFIDSGGHLGRLVVLVAVRQNCGACGLRINEGLALDLNDFEAQSGSLTAQPAPRNTKRGFAVFGADEKWPEVSAV